MDIAILGMGNGGCAVAADLSLKGHNVTLVKTSNSVHMDNYHHLEETGGSIGLFENGELTTAKIDRITKDLSVISSAQLIIIYIQTNYHEELIKKIVPYIRDGQIVLFNPGYLSTTYMLKHCPNKDITIVEAESSFIDCRISEPGQIKVGFRNVRNPIGIYPSENINLVKEQLNTLGYNFEFLSSVVEAALHNPNLIVHTVGAIMSIPRIEKTKGDYVMYHEVFTPSVWNILEKLDMEKMDVLDSLGYERLSYVEACKFRNSLDDSRDAKEVFFWYANMPTRAKGPVNVDSRYISEDVPQGLVMLEAIAKQLKIETPICTSLIEIASAALGRDLRKEGRTLEKLGTENIEKIIANCKVKIQL